MVQKIVGPLELDVVDAAVRRERVADGEACDQRDLVRQAMLVNGEDEGDGEAAGAGPPGIAPATTSGELVRSEDDRGGEEFASLAKGGRVVVGAAETGKEVETERFNVLSETTEIE